MSSGALAIIAITLAVIGLGVAFLTLTNHPDRVKAAKLFFSIAALIYAATLVYWTVTTSARISIRFFGALAGFSLLAIGLIAGFRFANRAFQESRESLAQKRNLCWVLLSLLVVIAISAMVVIIGVWLKEGEISVYPGFQSVYDSHKLVLLKPTTPVQTINTNYFAAHDHAYVFWDENSKEHYQLMLNDKTWKSVGDQFPPDDSWMSDACNRKRFPNTPKDKYPPWAGVAWLWCNDKSAWEGIGWRNWDCNYFSGITHKQEFEGGIIVEVFRIRWDWDSPHLLILTNADHKWKLVQTALHGAPRCEKPIPNPPCPQVGMIASCP